MRWRYLSALPFLAGLVVLTWGLLSLPAQSAGLAGEAHARLPESGVTNPVTAVLLNYRAYDTLLEVAVLLLAIVGVWALRRATPPAIDLRGRPLVGVLIGLLVPVLVVAAGYLLWVGAHAPGGAFQGGALLAGAVVLAILGGRTGGGLCGEDLCRAGLGLGLGVFAAAAIVSAWSTGGLLQYPPGTAGTWILIIEAAAMISIGLTLGLLYLGGRPVPTARPGNAQPLADHD